MTTEKIQCGEILPIETVIKPLAVRNKAYIKGRYFSTSNLIKLLQRVEPVCVKCGSKALHFRYYSNKHEFHLGNKLRLEFDFPAYEGAEYPAFGTIDHDIPKSMNGSDDPSNYQLMCNRCNSEKGNHIEYNQEELDWLNILTYDAYIRWYTQTFWGNMSFKEFASKKSTLFRECNQSGLNEVNPLEFSAAFDQIVSKIEQLRNSESLIRNTPNQLSNGVTI